jgi:hypothetical protein
MVFGEHLGEPPGYDPYFDAGMRLVDNPLRTEFNNRLGSPFNGLDGFDGPGAGGFDPARTVMHAQSHDNDYAARRELQHAMYFTRAGLGLLYTDGNYQAETLGESGGAFPRHSNTSFLGQWDDPRVPNLLYIHEQFARGDQKGKWSDSDVVIYERVDKRENPSMSDGDGVTLLLMLNDNYSAGQGRSFGTSFPATAGGSDAYLYNYSTYGGGFFEWASNITNSSVIIPEGGYFAFSWKNPDPSNLWANSGGRPLTIYQNNTEVDTVEVTRRDGPNGDADFHGDALPISSQPIINNPDSTDFTYTASIPRVTDGTQVRFVARTDGSAENILLKLDGGVDLNAAKYSGGDPRDNPPALATATFIGYEQANFLDRIGPEKFAATDAAHCIIGSAGADTYELGSVTTIGSGNNPQWANTATFIYHDPTAGFEGWVPDEPLIASNAQLDDSGNSTIIWAKTNSVGVGYKVHVYYTSDGSNPEGAGSWGRGTTQVVEAFYVSPNNEDGDNWWRAEIDPAPLGTIKYKIGIYSSFQSSVFPSSPDAVALKTQMMTTFQTSERDLTAVTIRPHNDYGLTETGLEEGMHIINARAFLQRPGQASIYNTFKQTFYYDTERPQGEIRFPENDGDTINGSRYGIVVRTDATVYEVWYRIEDSDTSNDDINTGGSNGNGVGFEPFIDTNRNGTRDTSESYEDLNENGVWDTNLDIWVRASELTPSLEIEPSDPAFRKEWRFDYSNIPATGSTTIKVRLRELSSSKFKDFALNDVGGHYTTLARNVNTAGPDERMFIAFPSQEGQIVDDSYVMKVYFSKSLADGLNEEQLIERFLISIGSNEEGVAGAAQSRDDYGIVYDETSDYHALAYTLPNLYNDIPDYDHKITVTHDRPSPATDFESIRMVRALTVTTPRVLIINPPELGSDSRPYEIILPDVPSPSADQRQFTIQVATKLDATDVSIRFVNLLGSSSVFLPAESVVDDSVLATIQSMGYTHTVVDQMRHFLKWFGRTQALGETGYQINEVKNVGLFPIHDFASTFCFQNEDHGLNLPLRELLSRRARSATQDQVLSLLCDWGDFSDVDNATAYDLNLRWIANLPWIELVTLDDVASGGIDLSQPADGTGDAWSTIDRGTGQSLQLTAKDFIDHATQEDYADWYDGQIGREEGLSNKLFEVRSEVSLPESFGEVGATGVAHYAWTEIDAISHSSTGQLGRSTAHAAILVTAFHEQQNNDLSKFSTGTYIYPDTDFNTLADFSKLAQSQMRFAALYKRVDEWAAATPNIATTSAEDIDLDREPEYLLYNASSFAVLEAIGGRCVAAFARNPVSDSVYQIIGTQPAYAGSETEEEGTLNVANGSIGARRTSAFKDWFAKGRDGGTSQYVNSLYSVIAISSGTGWTFAAPGNHIVKTITLDDTLPELQADYKRTTCSTALTLTKSTFATASHLTSGT